VARSLRWADEAAERRDYRDALGWLRAVEAAGDELPDAYQARRNAWLVALACERRFTSVCRHALLRRDGTRW
jgi:hypothetical protein